MKERTLILIVGALLAASLASAIAQVTNMPPAAPGQLPASTWQDILKVLQDFGINISSVSALVSKYYGPAWLAARVYRKYAPATWQNNAFGTACSHIGLELAQVAAQAQQSNKPS